MFNYFSDSQWILILLVTAEVAIYASCIGYSSEIRHNFPKDTFSLHPLRNDEYVPPIPVRIHNPYLKIEHSDHIDPNEHSKNSKNKRYWIPLIYPDEDASPAREIYVHPLAYRERISITASSPLPVTDRPETFNIPLRKSIRVSNSGHNQPAIQTTGYIKEAVVKNIPIQRPTMKPKNTIIVDKQTTAQSVTEVLTFEDNWKPKRITTMRPRVKEVKMTRKINPIPFTRFSDTGHLISHSDLKDENRDTSKTDNGSSIPKSTGDNFSEIVKVNANPPSGISTSHNKFANENIDTHNTYFQQPVIKPVDTSTNVKDSDHRHQDSSTLTDNPLDYQKPFLKNGDILIKTDSDIFKKLPDRKKLFIGVEYADSEMHGVKDNSSHISNINSGNKQTEVLVFNSDKTTESNSMKIGNYVKQNNEAQALEPHIPLNHKLGRLDDRPNHEAGPGSQTTSGHSQSQNSDSNGAKLPLQVISGAIPFTESQLNKRPDNSFNKSPSYPNAPFYGDIHPNNNNKEFSKEQKEDQIYFPQIFPDPHRRPGTDNKSNASTITFNPSNTRKELMDRGKLIEFNTKQFNKNKNDIGGSSSHGNIQKTHYNPPKAVTTNDFSSHSYHSPTPPSLITVGSVNSDIKEAFDGILDPKRTGNKVNRTETYILQRKPSLFPDFPETNRPRKPNIKISSGMLAGILIAALIFLGFLTGTYFILIHK
ncbi:uncharacterized protein NPIL_568881 [Nephila pilipes]|uniref:Uncharacterized protein n=1 Tax=Nephila pilipes TaxID=299642 RepID=A0A8X6R400_NEPPI|nr:uncharacterized protein NPIL_568881 [Nephila pilipes]